MIFAATLAIALFMRNVGGDSKAKQRAKAKAKLAELDSPSPTKDEKPISAAPRRRPAEQHQAAGQSWRSSKPTQLSELAQDLPRCVDTVCELVAPNNAAPGQHTRSVGL